MEHHHHHSYSQELQLLPSSAADPKQGMSRNSPWNEDEERLIELSIGFSGTKTLNSEQGYSELARRQVELAEEELAKAKRMREEARAELERAQKLKEEAARRLEAACLDITCHSCRQRFQSQMDMNISSATGISSPPSSSSALPFLWAFQNPSLQSSYPMSVLPDSSDLKSLPRDSSDPASVHAFPT